MCLVNGLGIFTFFNSTVNSTFDCRSRDHKFESQFGHITFAVIDPDMNSTVILPFCLLIKGSCELLAKVCAQRAGPSCSKLMMLLVNASLKL